MTDVFNLEDFDADGAIQETAEKAGIDTRSAFLKKAGIGAGALLGTSAFAGAIPALATAGTPASDVAILNFALTLEFLEAAFYTEAAAKGNFSGPLGTFVKVVKDHENQHVAALKAALGSAAVKSPKFNFRNTTSDEKAFRATSQVLEDTGVAAYLGQVGNIKSKGVLVAAGSILPIEARHAGWIRTLNQTVGAPHAFEKGKNKAAILAAVGGTKFIVK